MRPFHRALILISCVWAFRASAQRAHGHLPLESFTAAQGLANDSVNAILQDSRGFLWFATLDGLSRYDGSRFVNYTTDDGLPDRMIWSLAEDRSGSLWLGTSEGLVRMTPTATRGKNLFTRVPATASAKPDGLNLLVGRDGTIWTSCGRNLCAVRNGRLEVDEGFRRVSGDLMVGPMTESASGELWVGTSNGVYVRRKDGSWRRIAVHPGRDGDGIGGVSIDDAGRAWIATGYGLIVHAPLEGDADARPLIERAGTPLLPGSRFRLPRAGETVMITIASTFPMICRETIRARDGTIWQPCYTGLFRVRDGAIDYFDAKDGVPLDINAVAEDAAADIWIATRGSGALRLVRSGATTFTRAHGLVNQRIMALFTLDDGTLCANNKFGVSCFAGGRIHHASLWPEDIAPGWGWNQTVVRDRDGSLWATSGEGLLHWPRPRRVEDLARAKPLKIYTTEDGIGWDDTFRVWQDSRGAIWVSTFGRRPLSRRDDASDRFVSYGPDDGITATPSAFAEDRAGNIWIGLYAGGVLRMANGVFEPITRDVPSGLVRDLKLDSKGGLWIGTTAGVARVADPTAPANKLALRRYSRADGLTSDSGYCFVEMPDGRMAIGSQRGLDILDPRMRSVMHVSTRDGLASNEVTVAALDRHGALWLGTVNGLSRLNTIPEPRPAVPPRPRILTVTIDGIPTSVPELGTTELAGLRIAYPRHSMTIGFSAPDYDAAHPIRFEYRLAGNDAWMDLGPQRSIAFDRLRSGHGLLEIRTTAGGRTSPPARVSFEVIPAIWKRTWFLALVAAIVLAVALALHRYRVAHLLALERVRTRVATDLHDDLGSSLSRISILSEAAKRKVGGGDPEPILDEIADSARGLVDALGDSIWSIDPLRDDVRSLLQRARHFAAAVFEAQSIAIDVRVPPEIATMHLGPEQRREIYLILKEALNNAAKHAQAQHVAILATTEDRYLRIAVKDDGKGFLSNNGASRENGGRGVPSMLERARRVGGKLEIASKPGEGTTVAVDVRV